MNMLELARKNLARREYEPPGLPAFPEDEIIEGVFRDAQILASPSFNLTEALHSLGPLPDYSVFIGMCEDGLPFLMDLRNPAPGSILILGEAGSGKTGLLAALLTSAIRLNPPGKVNLCLITPRLNEVASLAHSPHCQAFAAPYDRKASEMIIALCGLVERRRNGRDYGPAVILGIDDLASFSEEYMDEGVLVHLKWLIQNGPQAMVWPVVTLRPEKIGSVDRQLLNSFQTRFLGSSAPASPARRDHFGHAQPGYLLPEPAFDVQYEREWIRFLVPSV